MTGFEMKRKSGRKAGMPAQFAQAYPDARFECITPSEIAEFLL